MLQFPAWKIGLVLAVCLAGLILAAPNTIPRGVADRLPEWLPHKQISLGLDLQGGSYLLLEVDVEAMVRERLEDLVQATRQALREKRIGYRGLGIRQGQVAVQVREAGDVQQAVESLRKLATPLQPSLFGGGGSDIAVTAGENGSIAISLTEQAIKERRQAAVTQSITIVDRRINETGVREPIIQRQGDERILVQLPGIEDPDQIKRLLGKTAKMVFRLVNEEASVDAAQAGQVPPGSELLEGLVAEGQGPPPHYVVYKKVMVSGENLIDAQPTTDSRTGQPVVSFRFDSVGGKRFGDATAANVGRRFAIVLDGKVVSAPVIREPILGGSGQISGAFSFQEVTELAILLRAGALPAPLKILEERSVGPSLGADSVRAGKIASVIGMVLVIVFMFLAYGLFGLAANVALLTNLVLVIGALSALQATLTLPGIAGIVLTIGMAVDANVLVFERVREEIASGKTPFAAVDAGYTRALTTIIDANVTTLIAAVLLFEFGSGPVKGFAVTLAIGIATSMFTAVMLSRMLIVLWLRRRRPATLPI